MNGKRIILGMIALLFLCCTISQARTKLMAPAERAATVIRLDDPLVAPVEVECGPTLQEDPKKADFSRKDADICSDDSVCLADAVKALNARAAKHAIGKDQQPLTEEEVIGAIRAWEREKGSPVSDKLYSIFKRVADTRELPKNAELEGLGGLWVPSWDFYYDVWWIRVKVEREDGSSYGFPIRERIIRSRTLEEELCRVSKLLFERGAQRIPGDYRLDEYFEELKMLAAARKQKVEGSEDLKCLPHGPDESTSRKIIKVNRPGTLGGNLEVPMGPYSAGGKRSILGGKLREPGDPKADEAKKQQAGGRTVVQELKTEVEALREQLCRVEKRLVEIERGNIR